MRIKEFLVKGTFGVTFASLQRAREQANLCLPSLCVPRRTEARACASVAGILLKLQLAHLPFLPMKALPQSSGVWLQEFEVLLYLISSREEGRRHASRQQRLSLHISLLPLFDCASFVSLMTPDSVFRAALSKPSSFYQLLSPGFLVEQKTSLSHRF